MASLNKVIIIGNLGADPEVRYTAGGQVVVNFNVATNERWTNKSTGQPEERTEWHRVVAWAKLAERCKEYLSKGRTVYVEGRLQTRKWEDREGQTKSTTEIIANSVLFLGSPGGRERVAESVSSSVVGPPAASSTPSSSSEQGPPPFDSDEEIPF